MKTWGAFVSFSLFFIILLVFPYAMLWGKIFKKFLKLLGFSPSTRSPTQKWETKEFHFNHLNCALSPHKCSNKTFNFSNVISKNDLSTIHFFTFIFLLCEVWFDSNFFSNYLYSSSFFLNNIDYVNPPMWKYGLHSINSPKPRVSGV